MSATIAHATDELRFHRSSHTLHNRHTHICGEQKDDSPGVGHYLRVPGFKTWYITKKSTSPATPTHNRCILPQQHIMTPPMVSLRNAGEAKFVSQETCPHHGESRTRHATTFPLTQRHCRCGTKSHDPIKALPISPPTPPQEKHKCVAQRGKKVRAPSDCSDNAARNRIIGDGAGGRSLTARAYIIRGRLEGD